MPPAPIAPGAHIEVRDAVWRVLRVDRTSSGTQAWSVVGVSDFVRDQPAIFLEELEQDVAVLDPATTTLVHDDSGRHRAGLLYVQSLLRDVPPEGPAIAVGHRAAMDVMDFQLEPAWQALQQLRPRILIADAVGLGKTLEAGILLSELIRRGRARRILVVTLKSMLTQFQKELWARFAIPLVRLDSVGLQRIRRDIPTNHNPFYHFDRAIISIDTLKQKNAFRSHIQQARWDVVVIDEAHNVAERGGGSGSLRAELARTLKDRCESLILLSATPHDGKAKSFASLMNMLDPTAITDPDHYTRDEIRGLFIRRFKGDVQDQLRMHCPEPVIEEQRCAATPAEEAVFDMLTGLQFTRIDRQAHGGHLFRTTLEKALFSSPAACLQTVKTRIGNLQRREDAADFADDIATLQELAAALRRIGSDDFAKLQALIALLRDGDGDFQWKPRKRDDRLVIFTERVETLKYLGEHLPAALGLSDDQVVMLHGGLGDTEQQHIVEEFGREGAKVRLLLASDVASEGLNLHYLSHKLVHFDVPWSLMVFRQRNGRIDRYGQERTPYIRYLLTASENDRINGDMHILRVLIAKDKQANQNIGDPAALMGAWDVDEDERVTGQAMEEQLTPEQFQQKLASINPMELMLALATGRDTTGDGQPDAPPPQAAPPCTQPPALYPDAFEFLAQALELLREDPVADGARVDADVRPAERYIDLAMPLDLRRRMRRLPPEVTPRQDRLSLTADPKAMMTELRRCRADDQAWPTLGYLWPLHPVIDWVADRLRVRFGRHTAPVIGLPTGGSLPSGERVVVVSALLPNRRATPLFHRWYGAVFSGDRLARVEPFAQTLARTGLGRHSLANPGPAAPIDQLQALVPRAVDAVRIRVAQERDDFQADLNRRIAAEKERLDQLRARKDEQLQLRFAGKDDPVSVRERARQTTALADLHAVHHKWVVDAMTTESTAFLQVIAVLAGREGTT